MEFGLKPYNFEPEYTEEELAELEATAVSVNKEGPDKQHTCRCTHCQFEAAIGEDEKTCCMENDLTVACLEEYSCITDHPHFDTIVLNRAVLEVAFVQSLAHRKSHATAPTVLCNRRYRLTAYRQFVCWMMKGQKLGKGTRVPIPSCVLQKIRETFPETDLNQYTGFKFATVEQLFT